MNDNNNPKNQDEKFRNALLAAFKSTPRGRDAYIDPADGCIVIPMAIRRRKRHTNPTDEGN